MKIFFSCCFVIVSFSIFANQTDIKWNPKKFVFKPSDSVKYIDYQNGNDSNPGTKARPWKHHPWDKNVKANAALCSGIHTYVFKKGVIYRGRLDAKESGEKGNKIRLTSDPSWGKGEAVIVGSVRAKGKWKLCSRKDIPKIVSNQKMKTIWYLDTDKTFTPRLLWEVKNDKITRIPIARTPNWKIVNQDDPKSEWNELTGSVKEVKLWVDSTNGFKVGDSVSGGGKWLDVDENRNNIAKGKNRINSVNSNFLMLAVSAWKNGEFKKGATVTNGKTNAKIIKIVGGTHDVISRLIDKKNLLSKNPEYYRGAVIWAEYTMPKPCAEKVLSYDPKERSLKVNYHLGIRGPGKFNRYILEALPQFLDSPGEYCYMENGKFAGRLYLRLPGDCNPNESQIELAKELFILHISNQSNIDISGLSFRFSNIIDCGTSQARHAAIYASAIRLNGSCSNIKMSNLKVDNTPAGIVAFPEKKKDIFDYINVIDSAFRDIDSSAVFLSAGTSKYDTLFYGARLIHAKVLRNKAHNIGFRSLPLWSGGKHAIHVEAGQLVEIASNVIDKSWGAGIFVFNGFLYSRAQNTFPLMRVLIHNNKVTNSLLSLQDFGGIASWMGGPSYIYNNISGNPVGYKHLDYMRLKKKNWYRTNCYGVGIYLDGQYKSYVFNNIIWGKNNNVNDRIYNSAAFNEAMGFMNTVFNNTMYRFGVGLHKGMVQHNRGYYLGNLMLDIGLMFISQEVSPKYIDYKTLAFAKNIFQGKVKDFGNIGSDSCPSINDWKKVLASKKVMVESTGKLARKEQVVNAAAHDFRLKNNSVAIGSGVKVFVPWALYGVVGEWGFYKNSNPNLVIGENINWNSEWKDRQMFDSIPRNNLTGVNFSSSDYVDGTLENWIKGALKLNGKNQYLTIKDSELKKGYKWKKTIPAGRRPHEGFYKGSKRETVDMESNNFLIEAVFKTTSSGGLVSKLKNKGYELKIDKRGFLKLSLSFGTSTCSRKSSVAVNHGKWHHVIAEVNRDKKSGINIYVDGKLSNGDFKGHMEKTLLANSADFLIGKTSSNEYFSGLIDFIRVSRGSLKDAETNIAVLYNWEFNGPFLKDFFGRKRGQNTFDAGAIQFTNKKTIL